LKNKKVINGKILLSIYVIYALIVIMIHSFFIKPLPEKYALRDGWTLIKIQKNTRKILEQKKVELPFLIKVEKGETGILEREVTATSNAYDYFYLNFFLDYLKISKDGLTIYEHGKNWQYGKKFHIVPMNPGPCNPALPSPLEPYTISLELSHTGHSYYYFPVPHILPHSELLKSMIWNDIIFFMISGFVLSMSVLLFIYYFYQGKKAVFLFSGLFIGFNGIWTTTLIPSLHNFESISLYASMVMKITAHLSIPLLVFLFYYVTKIHQFFWEGILWGIFSVSVLLITGFGRNNVPGMVYFVAYFFYQYPVIHRLHRLTENKRGNATMIIITSAFFVSGIATLVDAFKNAGFLHYSFSMIQWTSPIYAASLSFYLFLNIAMAARQKEMILKNNTSVKLKLLMASINPHFLFNSLSTVYSLININPTLARETLMYLSDVYHHIIESKSEKKVTLESEWRHIQNYTRLLQIRFPGRFTFDLYCSSELMNIKIYPLALHVLLENFYKSQKSEKATISVHIKKVYTAKRRTSMTIEFMSVPGIEINRKIRKAAHDILGSTQDSYSEIKEEDSWTSVKIYMDNPETSEQKIVE